MNPYAPFLDGGDQVAVISATAEKLARILHAMGETRAQQSPAPGKWNAGEIVCHLADTEIVFAFRLRQALAQDHHVIQPFDQDVWAARYQSIDAHAALTLFSAVRHWNLLLIRPLTESELNRSLTHPERGAMTLRTLIETMAGHDLNHLRQLAALADHSA